MLRTVGSALMAAASMFVVATSVHAAPGAATQSMASDTRIVIDVKRGGGRGIGGMRGGGGRGIGGMRGGGRAFGGVRGGGARFYGGRGINRGFGGVRRFRGGGRGYGRRGGFGIYLGSPFISPGYGYRSYSNAGSCRSLLRRAQRSGRSYWWNRYRRCVGSY